MRLRLLALVSVLLFAGTSPAQEFFFKDGDVVVVMGDSITEQCLYSNYLEMWTVSRFPAWKLTFRNVGIGGDRSGGGNGRFARDVLAYKPTAMTVDFGMNDGNYQPFNPAAFDVYMKGLQGIADQARAAKIRVAWVTPQPTERGPEANGYNDTLGKFSAGVEQIAKKNDGLFCDQFHPYYEVIKKAREADPKITIMGGDAVHPGPPGQAVMAASILKAMHFPREVSSVSIDLGSGGDVKAKKCKVTGVDPKGGGVRFQRVDEALPYFPEDARSILKWTPLLDDMNDYQLQVKGLKSGRYEIRLGGKKVAEHTAAELAKGVNLAAAALTAGPVADQVRSVWKAVQAKTDFNHGMLFRGVILAPTTPLFTPMEIEARRKKLYEERTAKLVALDEAIHAALTMRPYDVAIVPAGKE